MTDYRFSHLVVTKHDGVLDVVLNRPEARNAINRVMDSEFNRCLDLAAGDREVRAVMIRGNGGVFSAGHDLKESWRRATSSSRRREPASASSRYAAAARPPCAAPTRCG